MFFSILVDQPSYMVSATRCKDW